MLRIIANVLSAIPALFNRSRLPDLSPPGYPIKLGETNQQYVLDCDVDTDSTFLIVNADGVKIDMNGHSVTYAG